METCLGISGAFALILTICGVVLMAVAEPHTFSSVIFIIGSSFLISAVIIAIVIVIITFTC